MSLKISSMFLPALMPTLLIVNTANHVISIWFDHFYFFTPQVCHIAHIKEVSNQHLPRTTLKPPLQTTPKTTTNATKNNTALKLWNVNTTPISLFCRIAWWVGVEWGRILNYMQQSTLRSKEWNPFLVYWHVTLEIYQLIYIEITNVISQLPDPTDTIVYLVSNQTLHSSFFTA